MTTRTDIRVDYNYSPRIIEVASPSTEIIMQDLVDTLRIDEESFHRGLPFSKLIDASGKEDLGGGVKVGITAALQDAKLSFEARTTPAQIGVVTTGSGTPVNNTITFEDTSATFIANGVERGSLVINFTDNSIADVVSVDSETQLTTKLLVNGSDNEFDVSDVYHVFNVIQCSATGGNLVAVDDVGDTFSSILPTAFTQVVTTASSSATLQEQSAIQYSSFGGGVTVDVANGTSGTAFPAGTPQQPVDNLLDARTIAQARGFNAFYILGDLTIPDSQSFDQFFFVGESVNKTTLTLPDSASLVGCEYIDATVQGSLDGGSVIKDCRIETLNYVDGIIERCLLVGPITLGGSQDANFLDCWSGQIGPVRPQIDMAGDGPAASFRNYNGGLALLNKTGSADVSIDLAAGYVELQATVTDGTIQIRGVGGLDDSSGGTTTVLNELVDPAVVKVIEQLLRNKVITDDGTGLIRVRNDDDTADLFTAPIFEDVAGAIPFSSSSLKILRRDRFE